MKKYILLAVLALAATACTVGVKGDSSGEIAGYGQSKTYDNVTGAVARPAPQQ